mmetsp:Transcript_64082/g.171487  ORF Transcript_64082/g.171487 Transcript_64082/m.171487 type:complete len:1412 (-) Transcript_64082:386-4621(-)
MDAPLIRPAPVQAPEDRAGPLSIYTFWWVYYAIRNANQRGQMLDEDFARLPGSDDANVLAEKFSNFWYRTRHKGTASAMVRGLFVHMQWKVVLYSLSHGWLFLICMSIDPLILNSLLKATTSSQGTDAELQKNLVLVLVLSLLMLVRVSCMEVCFFASVRAMNNARTALVQVLFRRAVRSPTPGYQPGVLLNLMSTDADKVGATTWAIFWFAQWTYALVSMPYVCFCLYLLVGPASFASVGVMLVGICINRWLSGRIAPVVRRVQEWRDKRSAYLNEFVRGARTVKLQGWEDWMSQRVSQVREEELKKLVVNRCLQALNMVIGAVSQLSIPAVTFAYYVLVMKRTLDAATAFTVLAWLSQMQWSIQAIPSIFNMVANLGPSLQRLSKFLVVEEDQPALVDAYGFPQAAGVDDSAVSMATLTMAGCALKVREAEIGYEGDGAERAVVLNNVDLALKPGELVVLCGAIGSGKSSLLATLAKARPCLSGQCEVVGTRAYVQQKPFVLNATIRENVVFGGSLDQGLYDSAIAAAALGPDLETLPSKHDTLVGESGVGLSGGQKARVALARALYADSDILFLDDVLSAVDAHTGQHLWEQAIVKTAQRGRTVVLVTHQLQFVTRPEVSRVVILQNGGIWRQGSWEELRQHSGDAVTAMMERWEAEAEADTLPEDKQDSSGAAAVADAVSEEGDTGPVASALQASIAGALDTLGLDTPNIARSLRHRQVASLDDVRMLLCDDNEMAAVAAESNLSIREAFALRAALQQVVESRGLVDVPIADCASQVEALLLQRDGRALARDTVTAVVNELQGRDAQEEVRKAGIIAWSDFRTYLRAFGTRLTVTLLCFCIVATAISNIAQTVWLSIWTDKPKTSSSEQKSDLAIYVGIGLLDSALNCIQSLILTLCALRASRILHIDMLERVIRSPLAFFDITPTGRILNRFLRDMSNIDDSVPNAILDQATKTMTIITQLSLIYVEAPWIMLTFPVLAGIYSNVVSRIRLPARDTRRIEAVSRSPVYAQFGDVLHGRETVRAFGAEGRFERQNTQFVARSAQATYMNEATNKWAQALSTQCGCLMYLCAGACCVVLSHYGRMSSAQVGLVLMYAAQLQRALMDYAMGSVQLETQFVSVERVAEYLRNKVEDASGVPPRSNWPVSGALQMRNVQMRYHLSRPLVLRGVTLTIPGGSKVAVVGRTGCGKTSLFGVISRLYAYQGHIFLDDENLATLPLAQARRVVRVVAQDVFLVSGTLRDNLHGATGLGIRDSTLKSVLTSVGLAGLEGRGGLDMDLNESGDNVSAGEKQMLGLARALLPVHGVKAKVLLCDECTSNVDMATDQLAHLTIFQQDATVLMICHRLHEIQRYTHVAVMEMGRVVEFGAPGALLDDERSKLSGLCRRAGVLRGLRGKNGKSGKTNGVAK